MAEIDRLTVVWDARFDRMEDKLNKVIRSNHAAADKITKKWNGVNDNFSKGGAVTGALEGLAARAPGAASGLDSLGRAGLLAAAGIGAIATSYAATRQALQFADEIGDSAAKVGITTDALQEYRYAIIQLGGEAADADSALSGFTQTLGKALTLPTARNLKPFKALGLDPKELGDADTALKAVLDKLSRIQNEAQRQALAQALGLEKFIPLAREGTARLDSLREAARKVGYVMDAELIAKAGEANDKLDALGQVLKVQVNSALIELAPTILGVADAMVKAARATGEFFGWLEKVANFGKELDFITPAINGAGQATRRFLGLGNGSAPGRISVGDIQSALSPRPAAFEPIVQTGSGGRTARTRAIRDNTVSATAEVEAALLAAGRDAMQAYLSLTDSTEGRARIQTELLRLETVGKIAAIERQKAEVKADEGLSSATKAQLLKKLDAVSVQTEINALLEQSAADQETANKLQDEMLQSQREIADYYDQIASIEAANARTAKERRAIEIKALSDKQRADRRTLETELGQKVASKAITQSEADARLAAQSDLFGAQRGQVIDSTMGPLESYFDTLPQSIDDVNERLENMAANGISSVVDGLAGAAAGFNSLEDVAKGVLAQLTYDLTKLNLERMLGSGSGGGLLGSLGSLFGGSVGGGGEFFNFGGIPKFAGGTDSAPGGVAWVGERGRELVNLPRGAQVIPNHVLGALARRGGPSSSSSSFSPTLHVTVMGGGGSAADNRKTGSQIGAAAMARMADARRKGFD